MSIVKIQPLGKENYDTWCIHAKAYLIKNKLWACVQKYPKADASQNELDDDEMAKSELMLLIAPSELKQVKNCKFTRDVWTTLENIYASKGPARKATLLKQLILAKLEEGSDTREHLKKFMDTVDKLKDMDIDINSTSKCWSKNKNIGKKYNKKPNKHSYTKKDGTESNLFSSYFINDKAQKYWILDSGCTSHMTFSDKPFIEIKKISKTLKLASKDKTAETKGSGPAEIEIKEGKIGITDAL